MREYVPALRSLLAGDEVTTNGRYVTLDAVRLDWPPEVAPQLFAAAEGPKTLALSGEVADGTVLTGGTSVDQVSAARGLIAEGRAAAGRPLDHEVVVYSAAAFGADAVVRAEAQLAQWGMQGNSERILAGDPEQVAESVARLHDAGADAVILRTLPLDSDHDRFLAGVAEVARLTA